MFQIAKIKLLKEANKIENVIPKTSSKEESKVVAPPKENKTQEIPKEVDTPKKNVETTPKKVETETKKEETKKPEVVKFYESITHGKKEFASESEAFNKGLEIANKELNYVLDYNELHPEEQIKPDIRYYRVYPSIVDENGKTWYYLHFFCDSGEGNDEKLKNMFK